MKGQVTGSRTLRWLNPTTWWRTLDMDLGSLQMMMKASLPPTVVIAIHQSNRVADITQTVGYLAALMSVTAQCAIPRAKFLKIMFFNVLATCVAASICCLASFTANKARTHGTSASDSATDRIDSYNSTAGTICAIWLIVIIWIANAIRAWRPVELQDPMVSFSIFSVVTLTRVGTFVDNTEGLDYIVRLVKTFLVGFAIATGISLFVFPRTCRRSAFGYICNFIDEAQTGLGLLNDLVRTTSRTDFLSGDAFRLPQDNASLSPDSETQADSDLATARTKLQEVTEKLNGIDAKLQADLHYAKIEVAWGKLSSHDLFDISGLLRQLLLPLSGMSLFPGMVQNLHDNEASSDHQALAGLHGAPDQPSIGLIISDLSSCITETRELASAGLQFFLRKLELTERQPLPCSKTSDIEGRDAANRPDILYPNYHDFVEAFDKKDRELLSRKKRLYERFSHLDALALSGQINTDAAIPTTSTNTSAEMAVPKEVVLVIYLIKLQEMVVAATRDLVHFAGSKVADGTMKRSRLIHPKALNPRNWVPSSSDVTDDDMAHANSDNQSDTIHGLKVTDPEHLFPSNLWERSTRYLRLISDLTGSDLSKFGMRVAAASFSVGILAFLHQTQQFFIQQRGVWVMIVIVIGMSPTSGQSLFGFVARIVATTVAVVLSLAAWYIAVGKTPGVIVFLYLANIIASYPYVKKPSLFGPSVIAIVTLNVIIAYELQVRKLGNEVSESNGQPYYPIYIFGPYKLAAVAVGCAVSFFWVIFPYPITARSRIPRLAGQALFNLARYYSATHTTIEHRITKDSQNEQQSLDRLAKLDNLRARLYKQELLLLSSLRTHCHFATYEPPIGGRFPVTIYTQIISSTHQILSVVSLMAHISQAYPASPQTGDHGQPGETASWVSNLAAAVMESKDFQSHSTTSLLCHLASSLTNGQALPPFLFIPAPFPLARQLHHINFNLVRIRNVRNPAFAAFLSLELLRTTLDFELQKLLRNTRMLVGEVIFDT
ncbi:hypothetical protein GE09DRAFT_1043565 [Coniochaeta sp. 2T2.1]|nr:hypothetical protein GE09DRAFT_1043565 [Coniochaeta sp. 2T2.1]